MQVRVRARALGPVVPAVMVEEAEERTAVEGMEEACREGRAATRTG